LHIDIIGDKDFRGGDNLDLELIVTEVSSKGEIPVAATVSVKILGTAFRPVLLSLKTNRHGLVAVNASIPTFNTGRAAIVIKAAAGGLSTETRRVIHPG
jgi:dihydroorotate dehydrogenase